MQRKSVFIIAFLVLILAFSNIVYATHALVGVAGIVSESPRTKMFESIIHSHFDNILRSNIIASGNVFEPVNSALLREQLSKFNCAEESCMYKFAFQTKISVVIHGRIVEQSDSLAIELQAFGTDVPYFGKTIYRYSAKIPTVNLTLTTREYSYILEEHSARFISGLLKSYRKPIFFTMLNNRIQLTTDETLNGLFTIYRCAATSDKTSFCRYFPVGVVAVRNGQASIPPTVRNGDFILVGYHSTARELDAFYEGRKRELVFSPSSENDTFLMMLYTVPGSLTMPVVSPFLGYLHHRDYAGLALWSINYSPYLYITFDGLKNRPQALERNHDDITSTALARYRFSLYMLICGNMALFVDAFANDNLYLASNYQGTQRYMGNTYTAAYLSLISGGGGHFYRGWRGWGYFYFHLNNALFYYTIKEFSPSRRYDETGDRYVSSDINKKRAYTFLAGFGVVKLVEIIHAIVLPDKIQNGTVEEQSFSIYPFAVFNYPEERVFGAAFSLRF